MGIKKGDYKMGSLNKFSISLTDEDLRVIEEKRIELQSQTGIKITRCAMIRRIVGMWIRQTMFEERYAEEGLFSKSFKKRSESILVNNYNDL